MSDVEVLIKSYQAFYDQEGSNIDTRHQLYRRIQDSYGSPSHDNWWRYREASRFVHLQYEPILPEDEEWEKHITVQARFLDSFPHRAKHDPNLISWTPNGEYALADRRVVGKPGRFLTSRLLMTDEALISSLVNRFNVAAKPVELRYATTLEQITWVYRNGPTSCMSKGFVPHVNPLQVYATPGLCVAYLWQEANARITARTLLRTDRTPNEYTRIYGNEFALSKYLRAAGHVFGADGLLGLELGKPCLDTMSNRMFIAYIDLPHQYLIMDFAKQTLTVAQVNTKVDREYQFLIAATDASGRVGLDAARMQAWINKDPAFLHQKYTFKRRSLDDTFWGGYDQNEENDEILCSNCEEFCDQENLSPDYQGHPVCNECIDDHYVPAVNGNGNSVFVHSDTDGLYYVECVSEYCIGIDPCDAFEVVELLSSGDYCRTHDALYSSLMGGYLHMDEAVHVSLSGANTDMDTDYVDEEYLRDNQGRVLYLWSQYGTRRYPLDHPVIYIIPVGANIDEQKQEIHKEATREARADDERVHVHAMDELTTYIFEGCTDVPANGFSSSADAARTAIRHVPANIATEVRDRLDAAQRTAAAA